MAFRQRLSCYACNLQGVPQQMPRIGDDQNKQQIAVDRRSTHNLPELEVQNESRLCFNCNRSIINEMDAIANDPAGLRLNVIVQRFNNACVICRGRNDFHRLSLECRVGIFIHGNIYVPENVRMCRQHLNENGILPPVLVPGLQFINRPIKIQGREIQHFLGQLRTEALNKNRLLDMESLTDDDFQCMFGLSKENFKDLLTYCDPVPEGNKMRHVSREDLMLFLCKIRQGLSDEFLKVIFACSTRQAVSMKINTVRASLAMRFVMENIGVQHITREQFIQWHVTAFANELYNDTPEQPKAIVMIDSSYAYIDKSSNFKILKQSYSVHKSRHLLKPTQIVGPDGYLLASFGPYFTDSRNNDAAILEDQFNRDAEELRQWFQNGDIILVDRAYRDCVPFLERLGIEHKMPALLERGQRQLTTEDANQSRLVTKLRWVVEARHAHYRSVFKIFDHTFEIQNAKYVGDYYRIAGAIFNRYHPPITMRDATVERAREMLRRAATPNVVQARVELENLTQRNGQWARMENEVPNFPRLNIDFLRDLTYGTYQVNLSPGYIQNSLNLENNNVDEEEEMQIDQSINDNNFIRVRIHSRYRGARINHQVFIAFIPVEELQPEDESAIAGYYCTCFVGARTVGTCCHIACVLWYLSWARHQPNVRYPDTSLLNTTLDAAHRAD